MLPRTGLSPLESSWQHHFPPGLAKHAIIVYVSRIKAIIFDASGTILNDIHAVWQANADAYDAIGLDGFGTLEEFKDKFKLPVPEFHRDNGVPPDLIEHVDLKFREVYPKYAALVGVFPEVRDTLLKLRGQRMLLGVASNIPKVFLQEHLAKFEIEACFDVIIGQEDAEEQKPSPKPILAAIEKMGTKSQESMYVGDMEEDIIAAKAANALATAIVREESYHPRWRLERQAPDFFITDLRELSSISNTQ